MNESPARVLYDENGNPVSVVQDGVVYKLEVLSKLQAGSAIIGQVGIDPAQKGGLAEQATLASLDGKDFATETTLTSADTKLGTIDGVLDSIKDVDGVKKITDPLPAGTNEIGQVAQGTKGAGSNAWPTALHDTQGNAIDSVDDGGVRRLRVNVAGSVSIASPGGGGRNVSDFLKNGSSENLLVDGSGTPVTFDFNADPTDDIIITELRLVMAAGTIAWSGLGKSASPLPNGLLLEGIVNNGASVTFTNLTRNLDIIRLPVAGSGGAFANFGAQDADALAASFNLTGQNTKLIAGSGDRIRATVRDDLSSNTYDLDYLTVTFYGYVE